MLLYKYVITIFLIRINCQLLYNIEVIKYILKY